MNLHIFSFIGLVVSGVCTALYVSQAEEYSPYGEMMARHRRLRQQLVNKRKVEIEKNWPADMALLRKSGQISGVDTDPKGNVHVFRRMDHTWTTSSFNNWMQYKNIEDGPISEDAVVVLNKTGHKIRSWGKNIFYMPHGLTVDENFTTWVTDVALHQVLKFPLGSTVPSMTLGKKLVPGRSVYSFCMPTDVAIDASGNIYISDGYCNSRILMFRRNGDFVKQWGSEDSNLMLYIPHSLTMVRRRSGDVLCVADRENRRIICYQGMNNDAKWAVRTIQTTAKIYAIDNIRNTLIGVTYDGRRSTGFSFDTLKWEYDGQWNFDQSVFVHDIATDGKSSLYAANIDVTSGKKPVYKIDLEVKNNV